MFQQKYNNQLANQYVIININLIFLYSKFNKMIEKEEKNLKENEQLKPTHFDREDKVQIQPSFQQRQIPKKPLRSNISLAEQQISNDSDQKYQKNQTQNSTIDQQVVGYHIIGQESTNQVLQINLYPNEKVYIQGEILYTNNNQYLFGSIFERFKQIFKSGLYPLKPIHNTLGKILYLGINNGGGKLMIIDSDVYGDDIYFNPKKIIMSNTNYEKSIIQKHESLGYFKKRTTTEQKRQFQNTLTILQSKSNNIIIEKYLGQNQQIYVFQSQILALSGSVKLRKYNHFEEVRRRLTGPGWVFIENRSQHWSWRQILFILFLIILFYSIWT